MKKSDAEYSVNISRNPDYAITLDFPFNELK